VRDRDAEVEKSEAGDEARCKRKTPIVSGEGFSG
jgi:hypothetical protein